VILSRAAEVALAALPLLPAPGAHARGRGVKELAEAAGVPAPFLAQVLKRLAHRGLLRSKRGRAGGFVLGRPSSEITVADVVLALDGRDELDAAFPPLRGPAGALLGPVRDRAFALMRGTTLAGLGSRPDAIDPAYPPSRRT
jgi:Rrf2 family protein